MFGVADGSGGILLASHLYCAHVSRQGLMEESYAGVRLSHLSYVSGITFLTLQLLTWVLKAIWQRKVIAMFALYDQYQRILFLQVFILPLIVWLEVEALVHGIDGIQEWCRGVRNRLAELRHECEQQLVDVVDVLL